MGGGIPSSQPSAYGYLKNPQELNTRTNDLKMMIVAKLNTKNFGAAARS